MILRLSPSPFLPFFSFFSSLLFRIPYPLPLFPAFFYHFFPSRPTFFLFTLSSSFFFIRSFRSYVYVFMYFASRVLSSWIYLRYVNTTLHLGMNVIYVCPRQSGKIDEAPSLAPPSSINWRPFLCRNSQKLPYSTRECQI